MSFFSKLGKIAGAIVKVAAPVVIAAAAPESLVNVAAGAVVKHGMSKVPNSAIPFVNLAVSTLVSYGKTVAVTGDWTGSMLPALQAGGVMAAVSTGLHQSLKLNLKNIGGSAASLVGPGNQFSL